MKARFILLGVIMVVLVTLGLQRCKPNEDNGVSKEDRIDAFVEDLNNNRNDVYSNLHPTQSADYNASKDPAFWETHFPAAANPYSISGITISNSTVSATIGSSNAGTFPSQGIQFKMAQDGDDWQIEEITLSATKIVQ